MTVFIFSPPLKVYLQSFWRNRFCLVLPCLIPFHRYKFFSHFSVHLFLFIGVKRFSDNGSQRSRFWPSIPTKLSVASVVRIHSNFSLAQLSSNYCDCNYYFLDERWEKPWFAPVLESTVPEDPEGQCPDASWDRYDQHCYYFHPYEEFDWEAAQTQCVRLGGQDARLASIHSIKENQYIVEKLTEVMGSTGQAWIGMAKKFAGRTSFENTHLCLFSVFSYLVLMATTAFRKLCLSWHVIFLWGYSTLPLWSSLR